MSIKLTRREVMKNFRCYLVPYCDLCYFLNYFNPVGHTEGIYGWNADIYAFGNYAIVTGYRPFGEPLPRELIKSINEKSRKLLDDAYVYSENSSYRNYCDKVADLIRFGEVEKAGGV